MRQTLITLLNVLLEGTQVLVLERRIYIRQSCTVFELIYLVNFFCCQNWLSWAVLTLEIIFRKFKWKCFYMIEYVLSVSYVTNSFLYIFHLLDRYSSGRRFRSTIEVIQKYNVKGVLSYSAKNWKEKTNNVIWNHYMHYMDLNDGFGINR